ncbi:hypothetical protein C8F01DRAFT_1259168 [Mycena amicta]|nr:hypothetical protein C8F01DRAFT_1259168 [Mycena amicta]
MEAQAQPAQQPAQPAQPARAAQQPNQPPPDTGNASWTGPDIQTLLDYLVEKAAASGDGGNFRKTVFQPIADKLNGIRTVGGPKTLTAVMSKYKSLRKTFEVVSALMDLSGFTWDSEKGVNVTPEMEDAWSDYVRKHPEAAPFRKKGFPYYETMRPLMPSTAKGNNVFRPAADPEPDTPLRELSPPWDEEKMARDMALNGDDDDTVLDLTQSSSPTPQEKSRKRVAAQTAPAKRVRVSAGSQALSDLAASASDMNNILAKMFADVLAPATATAPTAATAKTASAPATAAAPTLVPSTPTRTAYTPAREDLLGGVFPNEQLLLTPQRRRAAILAAQQQENWLAPDEMLAFLRILQDVQKADFYMILLTDAVRIPWVQDELSKEGFWVLHPSQY